MKRMPFYLTSRQHNPSAAGRRDFVKSLLVLGGASLLSGRRLFSEPGPTKFFYKFGTMSVVHIPEMQSFIDKLRDENKISRNPVYRSYVYPNPIRPAIPEGFKDAKSLVILAVSQPPLTASFRHRGKTLLTVLPPGYYDDGIAMESLIRVVREEIVRDPRARIERAGKIHLKQAAVRSGLGAYGRNNICYVEGMGSFLALYAFVTDFVFPEDHWRAPTLLPECAHCEICYGACPTGAISRGNFVIDAGKCITLYNEIAGEFPHFILPSMHNALMGCMKCQDKCPANVQPFASAIRLEEVSEEETKKVLEGTLDGALYASLGKKLKGFGSSQDYFPAMTRNLQALIR